MFSIFAFPCLVETVIFGSKPTNEYWASLLGPSIDSKRYAVWYFFWSLANISRGWFVIVSFWIFRELAGLVWVGVLVPKAIPHFCLLRMVRKNTLVYYLRLICT